MRELSPRRRLSALQSRISHYAKTNGIVVARAYTRLAHALVCAAFTRAQREGAIPFYFVKGGAAMELRLGLAARATKDLDIGVASDPDKLLETLNTVLSSGYGPYTYRVKDARTLPNGTQRCEIAIDYAGLTLVTTEVDLAPSSHHVATDAIVTREFVEFDIEAIDIPCLSLPEQIAQKVHACTEPVTPPRKNLRHRDITDVLALEQQGFVDYRKTREYCEITFAQRATHSWPIVSFDFPAEWRTEIQTEPFSSVADVEQAFEAFLERIATG
ncbi:MAG TPA: nucleotidyl transferase AbiEii/AbiGii toxin family protein [Candidatus Baltobacteraceae bacterium]|jgi:predicted nucleotidyltransferase component of viral defense system|nr:nucleotidyl transferase AbiEii/AbiGii toxin family protein [Candidatus Baltobacteraceae bacterium]